MNNNNNYIMEYVQKTKYNINPFKGKKLPTKRDAKRTLGTFFFIAFFVRCFFGQMKFSLGARTSILLRRWAKVIEFLHTATPQKVGANERESQRKRERGREGKRR